MESLQNSWKMEPLYSPNHFWTRRRPSIPWIARYCYYNTIRYNWMQSGIILNGGPLWWKLITFGIPLSSILCPPLYIWYRFMPTNPQLSLRIRLFSTFDACLLITPISKLCVSNINDVEDKRTCELNKTEQLANTEFMLKPNWSNLEYQPSY